MKLLLTTTQAFAQAVAGAAPSKDISVREFGVLNRILEDCAAHITRIDQEKGEIAVEMPDSDDVALAFEGFVRMHYVLRRQVMQVFRLP
ncbi:MAG: hypothetical protein HYU57_00270 [Micavibrio aeruginosavorus]|nr:hypothetical protein [Micavibrio aeruginosavorus]